MNSRQKIILTTTVISVALTSLFFVAIDRYNSSKSIQSNDISIKKSDLPQINYHEGVYPDERFPPLTDVQRNELYETGIKPFLDAMKRESYEVIAIEIHPWTNPITLDTVLYKKNKGIFRTHQAWLSPNGDGTYFLGPETPPGYQG